MSSCSGISAGEKRCDCALSLVVRRAASGSRLSSAYHVSMSCVSCGFPPCFSSRRNLFVPFSCASTSALTTKRSTKLDSSDAVRMLLFISLISCLISRFFAFHRDKSRRRSKKLSFTLDWTLLASIVSLIDTLLSVSKFAVACLSFRNCFFVLPSSRTLASHADTYFNPYLNYPGISKTL